VLSDSGFDLLNKLLTYDPEKVDNKLSEDLAYSQLIFFLFGINTLVDCYSGLIRFIVFFLQRITAEAALKHDWFREVPLPKSKDFMPTFPAQHAQDRCFKRETI
jgi:cell division cycle 2-like protein